MKRIIVQTAVAAGLVCGGMWLVQTAQSGIWSKLTKSSSSQVILIKEPGKPERKCIIEKSTPQTDGTVRHQVRVIETGEVLTIVDAASTKTAVKPPPTKSQSVVADEVSPSPSTVESKRVMLPVAKERPRDPLFPEGYDPNAPMYPVAVVKTAKANPPVQVATTPKVEIPTQDAPNSSRSRFDELLGRSPMVKVDAATSPVSVPSPSLTLPMSTTDLTMPITPKVEAPKIETPKVDTLRVETPKIETLKVDTLRVEAPKIETLKVEAPKVVEPSAVVVPVTRNEVAPTHRWMIQLVEALRPSEREDAAIALTQSSQPIEPEVIAAIVLAARNDPAPSVRACCVHCLGEIRCQEPSVRTLLTELQSDPHEAVRSEVRLTRTMLGIK